MKGEGVSCPDLGSYRACSMWRYDESDDVYYPVWSPNDLPESESDLSTYARFTFPNGKVCDGYVVGVKRVFSIGLFGAGTMFFFNQNLPDLSAKQATKQDNKHHLTHHNATWSMLCNCLMIYRNRSRIFLPMLDLRFLMGKSAMGMWLG